MSYSLSPAEKAREEDLRFQARVQHEPPQPTYWIVDTEDEGGVLAVLQSSNVAKNQAMADALLSEMNGDWEQANLPEDSTDSDYLIDSYA